METLEDILREMREFADTESQSIGRDVLRRRIQHFADRIEQAVTNCNQLKLREALLKSRKAMDEMSMSIFQGWIEDSLADVAGEAQKAISSALSAPPRNCDVGSVEEQYDRCAEYCKAHNHDCKTCPLGAKKYQYGATCELYWSQMPYESEACDES